MNKIIALAALGSLGFFGVQAEENQNWFDSFYLAAGIGGDFVNNDDMTEDRNYSLKNVAGIGEQDSARKLKNKSTNRIIGSFIFGAGKTFDHGIYVGLEGSIDLAKSKKHDLQFEHIPEAYGTRFVKTNGNIKNDGISYSLGVRLGLVSNNVLIYFKPSIQFNKVSINGYTSKYDLTYPWGERLSTERTGKSGYGSKNKAFALALGVERACCNNNFSVRFEGEYVFPVTVKAESMDAIEAKLPFVAKANVRKINIRLLGVYNFKY